MEQWNATSRAVAGGSLPALFAAQAAATPDAIAAVYQDRELSYAALDAHANRLAHHLRAQGVGAETVVGLLVDRSLEMVIGLLGILKAGAAYLPLDPSYPVERLSFMLSDAGCSVLVTQQALLERLPALAAMHAARPRLIRLDADWGAIALEPAHAPDIAIAPEQAAYVIYTSGSTGTPKGVVVAHVAFPISQLPRSNALPLLLSRVFSSSRRRVSTRRFRRSPPRCCRAQLLSCHLKNAVVNISPNLSWSRRSPTRPCPRFCCLSCPRTCLCKA